MTKNIYFKILSIYINEIDQEKKIKLKNTYDKDYSINIDNNIYHIKSNQILDIPFTNKDLKIVIKLENNSFDFNFDFNKNANGFGSNTFVETENGPIIIKNLKAGDSILDCYGNNLIIENMYIFETSIKSNNKPIIIKKSKCGINLPYEDIIMNIKNTLKIKKLFSKVEAFI